MSELTARYEDTLKTLLADPEEVAAHLTGALGDGDQVVFMLALRNVAELCGMVRGASMAIGPQRAAFDRERG